MNGGTSNIRSNSDKLLSLIQDKPSLKSIIELFFKFRSEIDLLRAKKFFYLIQ